MGNNSSRPKICQVAPSHSQTMEHKPSLLPTSPWMVTVVKGTEMQEKGIVGLRKPKHLPPLRGRPEVPGLVNLEPAKGSQSACDKSGDSIIKSHPPQPVKGWQTKTFATRADLNPDKHARMAYKTAKSEEMEWRDGPVHCYSTPSLGGHYGTRKAPQEHMKGLLLAQTMLSRQATKNQQAQQRRFQERQGTLKKVCTTYVEEDERKGQKLRLVTRPRAQNIFWDEFEGQILDPRELMQPSPQLAGTNIEGTMHDKSIKGNVTLPEAEDANVL